MKTSGSGETSRDEALSHESDVALSKERKKTRRDLEAERSEVDAVLGDLEAASHISDIQRNVLRTLRARVRAQRTAVDARRAKDRVATDDAVRRERVAHDGAVVALTEKVNEMTTTAHFVRSAETAATEQRELDRDDAAQKLWRMLPELDSIATAVNAIRTQTCDRATDVHLFDLASEVQVAAERILDLVGDLLDPRDTHARYHDVGGSG